MGRWDGFSVKEIARRYALAASSLAVCLACAACGPLVYYVPGMKVDSEHHLIPVGKRTIQKPALDSYYYFFPAATGITFVTHWERLPGSSLDHAVLALNTNKDHVLDMTLRRDQVLTGNFGTLVAARECFYARTIEEGWSGMGVYIESNLYPVALELPVELPGPPKELPPVTSVSVVRIFRAAPEFMVISANYEANGALGSLNVGGTLGGERKDSSTKSRVSADDPDPAKYGIPRQIDIAKYIRAGKLPLPKATLPQEMALLIVHYGFGKFMREDLLGEDAIASSRFLQPLTTEEGRLLDPECDERFRRQQAMGLPTTYTY